MAQRNKSTLQSNINTLLADNSTGDISAADVRDNLLDITDSLLFNSGSQGITGSLTATTFVGNLVGSASVSPILQSVVSAGSIFASSSNNLIFAVPQLQVRPDVATSGLGDAIVALGVGSNDHNYVRAGRQLYLIGNTGDAVGGSKGAILQSGDSLTNNSYAQIYVEGTQDLSRSRIQLKTSVGGTIGTRFEVNRDNIMVTGSLGVTGSVLLVGLPTSEPATSGQLWLSGSAGSNSKVLCVRD